MQPAGRDDPVVLKPGTSTDPSGAAEEEHLRLQWQSADRQTPASFFCHLPSQPLFLSHVPPCTTKLPVVPHALFFPSHVFFFPVLYFWSCRGCRKNNDETSLLHTRPGLHRLSLHRRQPSLQIYLLAQRSTPTLCLPTTRQRFRHTQEHLSDDEKHKNSGQWSRTTSSSVDLHDDESTIHDVTPATHRPASYVGSLDAASMIYIANCCVSDFKFHNGHGRGFGLLRSLSRKRFWLDMDSTSDDWVG